MKPVAALVSLLETAPIEREGPPSADPGPVRLVFVLPIVAIHLIALGAIWVGFSWAALVVAVALYVVRMFAITAFYHRYFSHRTFRTSRAVQFVFALIGASSAQRGPLWWAAHHRDHHRHSDVPPDVHSPRLHGVLWSHMGWFVAEQNLPTNLSAVRDLAKFPELRWLDRWHLVAPLGLAGLTAALGWALSRWASGLGTDALQMFVWGFGVSTVALYHGTFTINSLAHVWGRRRFHTTDDSRNNFLLSVVTLGEGWHNNHHYFPGSARQGFYWWEFDPTYYALRAMEKVGLVWRLSPTPARVYEAAEEHRRRGAEGHARVHEPGAGRGREREGHGRRAGAPDADARNAPS